MRRTLLPLMVVMALAGMVQDSAGQDFVSTAIAGFPTQTLRVEYSSPAKLRKLPNYQSLRQRFVGPRLQQIESSLAQLGIREDDIDDLMMGWRPGDREMDLYGFASGRFDKAAVASRAAAQNLTPTPLGGQQAYCLQAGLAGSCVVVLENSARGLRAARGLDGAAGSARRTGARLEFGPAVCAPPGGDAQRRTHLGNRLGGGRRRLVPRLVVYPKQPEA